MPSNIYYPKIRRVLSDSRVNAYQHFFTNHSEQEIYGVYLWNMALSGAIYPLLQAAEIALRNAINHAAVSKYGDYWHEHIAHTKINPNKDNENYTKLKNCFNQAAKAVIKADNLTRLNNGQQVHPQSYRPNFNKVVSVTTFATWEYALHHCFFGVGRQNYLWPNKSKLAFKNRPSSNIKNTHIDLFDLVSEIRPFRNRLSHHEPLWKGVNVIDENGAIIYLNNKIDKIEQLINIIDDEKVKYLDLQGVIKKARAMASIQTLNVYRYRAKPVMLSLKHKNKVKRFLGGVRVNPGCIIFSHGDQKYRIESL
jgi:hypothetical protein